MGRAEGPPCLSEIHDSMLPLRPYEVRSLWGLGSRCVHRREAGCSSTGALHQLGAAVGEGAAVLGGNKTSWIPAIQIRKRVAYKNDFINSSPFHDWGEGGGGGLIGPHPSLRSQRLLREGSPILW